LSSVLPAAAYTAARQRGGWAMTRLRLALAQDFDQLGPALIRSRDQRERRLAYEIGAELGRWTHDDLVRFAVRGRDQFVRTRSAEALCSTGDAELLRLLLRSRSSGVRASALVGLARLGLDDEVAALMDDRAPLVRAYARSRADDPLGYYRAAVADHPQATTVAGLGEVGHYADEALLTPLLGHADPGIRAAAVRALGAIDCLPVAEVVPLLRDPSPTVTRAATDVLLGRALPAHLIGPGS
jgi:HEAT repeat protein